MKIKKMTNSGDEYLICDCRDLPDSVNMQDVMSMCENSYAVLLYSSQTANAEMCVIHPSGHEIENSAGAVLCAAKYITEEENLVGSKVFIQSASMCHIAFVYPEDYPDEGVIAEMPAPKFHKNNFNTGWNENFMIDFPFSFNNTIVHLTSVFVGEAYVVVFCDDLVNFPLEELAEELKQQHIISNKMGIIVAHVSGAVEMEIRVYDYFQGEKKASANGAAAAVSATVLNKMTARNVTVTCSGGKFIVHILSQTNHIMFTGVADYIY